MSDKANAVELVCPVCKTTKQTALDADAPQQAVLIELTCSQCLQANDSLPMEPLFKDKHGVRLLP